VVGMVITGAYALANRSLQEGVSASEHIQANKLAEGQVEALKLRKAVINSDTAWAASPFVASTTTNFCLDTTATSTTDPKWNPIDNTGTDPADLVQKGAGNGYDPACNPSSGNSNKFFIDVTKNGAPANNPTFLVTVRWEGPAGGPLSQSQLYYRF
jgi:hypothetical protein